MPDYRKLIKEFVTFLSQRPECNKKCTVDSNIVPIRHELQNTKYAHGPLWLLLGKYVTDYKTLPMQKLETKLRTTFHIKDD